MKRAHNSTINTNSSDDDIWDYPQTSLKTVRKICPKAKVKSPRNTRSKSQAKSKKSSSDSVCNRLSLKSGRLRGINAQRSASNKAADQIITDISLTETDRKHSHDSDTDNHSDTDSRSFTQSRSADDATPRPRTRIPYSNSESQVQKQQPQSQHGSHRSNENESPADRNTRRPIISEPTDELESPSFCPLCQMPFSALYADSPQFHVTECANSTSKPNTGNYHYLNTR